MSYGMCIPVQQPASIDSWRNVFFTMAGVQVVATLVFWMLGSGQRQWWAIYVEMPAPVTAAQPIVAASASDAAPSPSDEKRNVNEQQPATTDKTALDSARDSFASFMRQEERPQRETDV